jgi:pilus assembly protein CpaB
MNIPRLAIIGAVIAAGGGALFILSGDPPAPPTVEVEVPTFDTQEVLVAAREIPTGTIVSDLDLQWVAWPRAAISPAMISKVVDPSAAASLKGSIARLSMMEGEPIRRQKLVKGASASYIAAILPSGMRAFSIPIDGSGNNTAGGFILPNDRVDIIRTGMASGVVKPGEEGLRAEVILSDVRVLAIGRNVQETPGSDRTIQATNATLEVTPDQAQNLAVAQQSGSLALVLRSLVDRGVTTVLDRGSGVSVVRYGVESQLGRMSSGR